MASRMDKYRNDEGRSVKNKDIYKQMENIGAYTNIEGIATIEDNNQINISKIKEMLKNRENYQKEKRYREILSNEEKCENLKKDIEEIEKKYDIKDILSDALKVRNIRENDNHKFESSKYEILKELGVKENNKELHEMINTITNNKKSDADVNLFEDLKQSTPEENLSIKQIIDDAKESEASADADMDKTFFTNSLSLTSKDFEGLREMHTDIKKNNRLLIVFSILLAIVVIVCVLIYIFK